MIKPVKTQITTPFAELVTNHLYDLPSSQEQNDSLVVSKNTNNAFVPKYNDEFAQGLINENKQRMSPLLLEIREHEILKPSFDEFDPVYDDTEENAVPFLKEYYHKELQSKPLMEAMAHQLTKKLIANKHHVRIALRKFKALPPHEQQKLLGQIVEEAKTRIGNDEQSFDDLKMMRNDEHLFLKVLQYLLISDSDMFVQSLAFTYRYANPIELIEKSSILDFDKIAPKSNPKRRRMQAIRQIQKAAMQQNKYNHGLHKNHRSNHSRKRAMSGIYIGLTCTALAVTLFLGIKAVNGLDANRTGRTEQVLEIPDREEVVLSMFNTITYRAGELDQPIEAVTQAYSDILDTLGVENHKDANKCFNSVAYRAGEMDQPIEHATAALINIYNAYGGYQSIKDVRRAFDTVAYRAGELKQPISEVCQVYLDILQMESGDDDKAAKKLFNTVAYRAGELNQSISAVAEQYFTIHNDFISINND